MAERFHGAFTPRESSSGFIDQVLPVVFIDRAVSLSSFAQRFRREVSSSGFTRCFCRVFSFTERLDRVISPRWFIGGFTEHFDSGFIRWPTSSSGAVGRFHRAVSSSLFTESGLLHRAASSGGFIQQSYGAVSFHGTVTLRLSLSDFIRADSPSGFIGRFHRTVCRAASLNVFTERFY